MCLSDGHAVKSTHLLDFILHEAGSSDQDSAEIGPKHPWWPIEVLRIYRVPLTLILTLGVQEEAHCFKIKVMFTQGIKYSWLKLRSIIQLPIIDQSQTLSI